MWKDRTALVQLETGDSTPVDWNVAVGGAHNGFGLTSGQFYIENKGKGPRLLIDGSGNVGIGTTTPAYPLDIASGSQIPFRVSASAAWPGFLMVGGKSASGMNGMMIQNSTGQQYNLGVGGHTNSAVPDTFFIYDNNTSRFVLSVTPADHVGIGTQTPTHLLQLGGGAYCDGSGSWIAGSSVRWKENIEPLVDGVETLKQLHPVSYNRKETPGKTTMGFIAEEVGKVLPTVVDWDQKEAGYAEGYDHLAILALSVQALKEQQTRIEQLATHNSEQQTQITEQQKTIEQLQEEFKNENEKLQQQFKNEIEILQERIGILERTVKQFAAS